MSAHLWSCRPLAAAPTLAAAIMEGGYKAKLNSEMNSCETAMRHILLPRWPCCCYAAEYLQQLLFAAATALKAEGQTCCQPAKYSNMNND